MLCDNVSSIALASNHVNHARTKHIEIDCHFVRDKVKAGIILPTYVPTKGQIADILTKGLPKPLHYMCLSKLGMCNPYTMPTCRGDNGAQQSKHSVYSVSTNYRPPSGLHKMRITLNKSMQQCGRM